MLAMQKHNLDHLMKFHDKNLVPRVLLDEPGCRMVLFSMCAGQSIPEQAVQAIVTVVAILGHVTFYTGCRPCDLYPGESVCIESRVRHRVEAQEDSALLVLITASDGFSVDDCDELDLRDMRRSERHSPTFRTFDKLAVGRSFRLTNDYDPVPLNRQ